MPDLVGNFTQEELGKLFAKGVKPARSAEITNRFGWTPNFPDRGSHIGWDRVGRPIILVKLVSDSPHFHIYKYMEEGDGVGESNICWSMFPTLSDAELIKRRKNEPVEEVVFDNPIYIRDRMRGFRLNAYRRMMKYANHGSRGRLLSDGDMNAVLRLAQTCLKRHLGLYGHSALPQEEVELMLARIVRVLNIREQHKNGPLTAAGHFSICTQTGVICVKDTMQMMRGELVSADFLARQCFHCDGCGEYHMTRDLPRTRNNGAGLYCRACISSVPGHSHCARCDHYNFGYGVETCPHCDRHTIPSQQGQLQNYNVNVLGCAKTLFRRAPAEAKLANDPVWLGVELEVETRARRGDAILAMHRSLNPVATDPFVIFKQDGSLSSERGVEIVTVPASLAYHLEAWKVFFDTANPELKKASASRMVKAWSTGTCGMHVHIGVAAMTPLQLGRFMQFINDVDNGAFISSIAGRTITRNTNYCPSNQSYTIKTAYGVTEGGRKNDEGQTQIYGGFNHHSATGLSIRNSGKTVEVRIFRGNVAKTGFFKNLEFCHALVLFAQQTSNARLKTADFLAWFDQNHIRGNYKYLWQWLVERGWLDTPHKLKEDGEFYPEIEAA